MIKLLAMAFLLGPWTVELPVEGLTLTNAEALQGKLHAHFDSMKDKSGRHPFDLRIDVEEGGIVRIMVMCDADLRLADVGKALRGTPFKLRPWSWELFGKAAFEWRSNQPMESSRLIALKRDLAGFGEIAEVTQLDQAGYAYHAHLKFKSGKGVMAGKLQKVFEKNGVSEPMMLWENYPHMHWRIDCGGRRVLKTL